MTGFEDLHLEAPLLRAIVELGHQHPTPVQAASIPAILAARDVLATAETGSGKTAAFTLPVLQRLMHQPLPEGGRRGVIRALILTPTRELAAQVLHCTRNYSRYLPELRTLAVFGGVELGPQIRNLRKGADLLIATPGRLLDLWQQRALDLSSVKILILDEADRMLDMGFIPDLRRIIKTLPERRQNLLFSATFPREVRLLAGDFLKDPELVSLTPDRIPTSIEHIVLSCNQPDKTALLCRLIRDGCWKRALVFVRTRLGADRLVKNLLAHKLSARVIHGERSQSERTRTLADFKNEQLQILVATDLASRGLDIDQLERIINYDMPDFAEDYIHRVGRTGRAGARGCAYSLVSPHEYDRLREIEALIKLSLQPHAVPGYKVSRKYQSSPTRTDHKSPPRQKKSNTLSSAQYGTQTNPSLRKTSTHKASGSDKKHRPPVHHDSSTTKGSNIHTNPKPAPKRKEADWKKPKCIH
ncbi:MAG: DEAD/DEAH box helicase [Planctomycetes bacterium]|nr:DEAD/DEAH box helicase [Planctomycetota bacterium]